MMDDQMIDKLWRLQCLMAEIESKSEVVAKQIGFKDMHHAVYDYIKNVEYARAMASFRKLTPELQEKFIIESRQIYEGETQ